MHVLFSDDDLPFTDKASGTSTEYGPPPGITFDRFVRACVAVKTLTEAFQGYVCPVSPRLKVFQA